MLSYKEFEVVTSLLEKNVDLSDLENDIYRKKQYKVFKSKDCITQHITSLEHKGYLKNNAITDLAKFELEHFKVKNAVILAAGGSDISAKSVYSIPKGLYLKNGETLIERQIRQLQEAGVNDITIVVGYKQEMYFFLQEKWNVSLKVNPDLKKNNIYSLYMASEKLSNTYICNCDNYFIENPFSKYEYNSYHATVYKEDSKNELLVKKNKSGRLLDIYSGADSGECIYGHAYIDHSFSTLLVDFMEKQINDFRVSSLFWEEFVVRHINDLDMYVREYPENFLFEFDSIQEIQNIDGLFLKNVSSKINNKICEVLKCKPNEVKNIEILQKGLTNILFTFNVKNEKYIFRYPGESSTFFINRKNEVKAQELAANSGVDNTYIYIDETGIKISKFVDNTIDLERFYYKDAKLMKRLAKKIKTFHNEGFNLECSEEYVFNPIEQCERLMLEASKMKTNLFELFEVEWNKIIRIYNYTERDSFKKTMCHNDINQDNCLLTDHSLDIIDWEFAGWNDPAYDFGRVIAGYSLDDSVIDEILGSYFERPITEIERLHYIAYIAIHCWYYFGWALYKESINESTRDWMLFFYKKSIEVIDYVLPKYEAIYGK